MTPFLHLNLCSRRIKRSRNNNLALVCVFVSQVWYSLSVTTGSISDSRTFATAPQKTQQREFQRFDLLPQNTWGVVQTPTRTDTQTGHLYKYTESTPPHNLLPLTQTQTHTYTQTLVSWWVQSASSQGPVRLVAPCTFPAAPPHFQPGLVMQMSRRWQIETSRAADSDQTRTRTFFCLCITKTTGSINTAWMTGLERSLDDRQTPGKKFVAICGVMWTVKVCESVPVLHYIISLQSSQRISRLKYGAEPSGEENQPLMASDLGTFRHDNNNNSLFAFSDNFVHYYHFYTFIYIKIHRVFQKKQRDWISLLF